jgi:FAD-linked oxidoreductase
VSTDVLHPAGAEEIAALIRAAAERGRRVKVVGSSHSFSGIAVADDQRMHLDRMVRPPLIDGNLVTVPAAMPMSTLNALLATHGLAIPNLGDIDAQTIAGAIATGTHGTGAAHATLSCCVAAVRLVTGSGEILRVDADSDLFPAVRLGLGALGVLIDVTLRCVDAFTLLADERPMRLADVLARIDDDIAANDHVEFYWYPYTDRAQLKRNNVVEADDRPLPRWRGWLDDEFLANTVFQRVCRLGRFLPAVVPAISAVAARALTARTYTGRSDRIFCTPRRVGFVEMEYAVPRAAMPSVLAALPRIIARLPFKVQFPVEVRFTGPDDVWLSHSYGRESAYVAVHQFAGSRYVPYFRAVEALCESLGGRPHWGKMHSRNAESLRRVYPRFDEFLAVRDRLDPARVFTNPYLNRVLGP